jgi:hypothetical protein
MQIIESDAGFPVLYITPPAGFACSETRLYRSHIDLRLTGEIDVYRQPVTRRIFTAGNAVTLADSMLADNCSYYYYAACVDSSGAVAPSGVCEIRTPARAIGRLQQRDVWLFVDKINYFIALCAGSTTVKRYPISLGQDPFSRKSYYDCRTTPEGVYEIAFRNPASAFYKSFGTTYPNAADRQRYAEMLARPRPASAYPNRARRGIPVCRSDVSAPPGRNPGGALYRLPAHALRKRLLSAF